MEIQIRLVARILIPNVLLPVTRAWITSPDRGNPLWPTIGEEECQLFDPRASTSRWIISIAENHLPLSLLFSSYTYIRCKSVVDLEKEKLIERKLLKSEADTRNVRAVFIGWPFICSFYLLLPFIFVVGKSMEGMQPDKSKSKLNSQPRISNDLIIHPK